MEANNTQAFDLQGFLNDPASQADKDGAVEFLRQKGILNPDGSVDESKIAKPVTAQNLAPSYKPGFFDPGGAGEKIGNTVGGFLGGNKLGEFIGNELGNQVYGTTGNSATPFQALGDLGKSVLTPSGIAGVGTAGSLVTQAGKGALFGGGVGLTSSLANNEGASDTLLNTGIGAATGGVLPYIGAGLGKLGEFLANKLPDRIVSRYLPSVKEIGVQGLSNTPIGSVSTMLKDSQSKVEALSNQVQQVLKSSNYATHTGTGNSSMQNLLQQFPNKDFDGVLKTLKNLVPQKADLIDKVALGTANVAEKNTLRSAVDKSVSSVYSKLSMPPARKELGAAFAGYLRNEVQNTAPETQPVFQQLAKEINLRDALVKASKKISTQGRVGLIDIISGLGGFSIGGPIGTGAVLGGEKALRSPGVNLAAAKGISKLGSMTKPILTNPALKNILRTGVLKGATQF